MPPLPTAFVLLLLACAAAHGQRTPFTVPVAKIIGVGDDYAGGIWADPDGANYVFGASPKRFGRFEVWVRKFGNTGAELWEETFTSDFDETPFEILRGTRGEIFLNSTVSGFDGNASIMLLSSISGEGEGLWGFPIESEDPNGQDKFFSGGLAPAPDGGVFVSGTHTSEDEFTSEYVIARFDRAGSPRWIVSGSQADDWFSDTGNAVAVDSQGDVILAGADTLFDELEQEFSDPGLVLKLDADGNPVWRTRVNSEGNNIDIFYDVDVDSDDNLIAVGESEEPSGRSRAFVVKLDAAGNVLWQRLIDEDDFHVGWRVNIAKDGTIYVAGYTRNNRSRRSSPYLGAFDSAGRLKFSYSARSSGDAGFDGMSIDAKGDLYVTGTFTRTLQLGNKTLRTQGNDRRVFWAKLEIEDAFSDGPWERWRRRNFNADERGLELSEENGDADGDGTINAIEFALEWNPRQFDDRRAVRPMLRTVGGKTYAAVAIAEPRRAVEGVRLEVEHSDDLKEGSWKNSGIVNEGRDPADQFATYRSELPLGESPNREEYFRIKATIER